MFFGKKISHSGNKLKQFCTIYEMLYLEIFQEEHFRPSLKNTFYTATYFSARSHTSGKHSKNFGVKKLKTSIRKKLEKNRPV